MNFKDLVEQRQSCRNFDEGKIPKDEDIQKIIKWSHLAPSACNAQPYKITIAKGELAKEISKARSLQMNAFIEKAPVFFIIEEGAYNLTSRVGSSLKDQDYRSIDIGILTAHICFSATELGLSTCILGMYDERKIQELLGTKERIRLIIALGYEKGDIRQKKRKDLSKVWIER
ncbi:MAG: nitroreductase family protein [Tissierellia bacterium]|nr:nitroreductase family protein [Tissierellia bacterium]